MSDDKKIKQHWNGSEWVARHVDHIPKDQGGNRDVDKTPEPDNPAEPDQKLEPEAEPKKKKSFWRTEK